MADTTLTALTGASTLDGTELLYAVQGAADRKATVAQVKTWASTAPTIAGGTHTASTGLGIRSTGAAYDVTLASSEVLTAGRTLSLNVADAARTLTVSGSATVSQDYSTGGSPQFTAVNVGHATDTTVSRASAGDIQIEANIVYRAGGTDVAVADGGTGSSTAAGGATNLGLGTGDSPQFTAVNIGHATDTTLARVSAGLVSVEGDTVALLTATQTLSNKTLTAPDIGVATGTSLDVSGVIETGANSGTLGQVKLYGNTSGSVIVKPAAAAGTDTIFQLPANNGTNAYVLQTNGSGVTSWVALAGGGDMLAANNLSDVAVAATAFTNIKQAATESATGVVELATTAEAEAGTDTSRAITAAGLKAAIVGKHTIWVPATSMIPATTNGPSTGTVEQATNKNMTKTLDFDTTTSEIAQFFIAFPKSWDLGTVTFIPHWTAASGSGTFICNLAGVAISNDDPLDVAFGTLQSSTDTLITAYDNHVGPESAAITIAGTPAALDLVNFKVYRDVADTLAVDVKLIGIQVIYTTSAMTDD